MGVSQSSFLEDGDGYNFHMVVAPETLSGNCVRPLSSGEQSGFPKSEAPIISHHLPHTRVHPGTHPSILVSTQSASLSNNSNSGVPRKSAHGHPEFARSSTSARKSAHGNQEFILGHKDPTTSMTDERKIKLKKKIQAMPRMVSAAKGFNKEGANLAQVRHKARKSSAHPWLLKEAAPGPSGTSKAQFDFCKLIGAGYLGHVWVAKYRRLHGYVAIKQMSKVRIESRVQRVHQEKEAMLKLAPYPFLVNLFFTFQTEKWVFFVMEFIPGGDLYGRLAKCNRQRFSLDTTKFYACEVLAGLEYIHSRGYVYRDLKPENLLIDESGHIKIIDFGFARQPDSEGRCRSNVGTPAYLSPEQLNGKFTGGYTIAVDWWAFGCLIHEMLFSKTPFEGKTRDESAYVIYMRVLKGKITFPRRLPQQIKELLSNFFVLDLSKR